MSIHGPEDIFKSVYLPQERQLLIDSFITSKVEIVFKLNPEIVAKANIFLVEKGLIKCRAKLSGVSSGATEAICSFSLSGEKYFFVAKAHVKMKDSEIHFEIPEKFYVVQRRQHYRLKIPDSFEAILLIQQLNDKPVKIKGKLYNLSVGGCKVGFDLEDLKFKLDDEIKGEIQVKNRETFKFSGVARHIQNNTLGVEFHPFSPAQESRVFALTMDLHKEFFSHLK